MELSKRKKIRLDGYDYSQNGYYFITICTHNRELLFGEIVNFEIKLSHIGQIVLSNIKKCNNLYDGIEIDKFVIMPNHIHFIIAICRERIACVPNTDKTKSQIPKLIQQFKSSITKEVRNYNKERNACNAFPTVVWQTHFHDHIIRNEQEYQKIWSYIDENPLRWEEDCFFPIFNN